ERFGAPRGGEVLDAQVDAPLSGLGDGELFEAGERPRGGADLLQGREPSVTELEEGFHHQRGAEEGRRGADASAAAEVFERVDVGPGARPGGPAGGGDRDLFGGRCRARGGG